MAVKKLQVKDLEVRLMGLDQADYISLTDIAKYRSSSDAFIIINNWMRSRDTIEFLGLWEKLSNPDFKPIEFDRFKSEAGSNYFVLSPQRWIEATGAIGIISKSGRYGGTFAHSDIAFEFASWISPEFKLYLIKEVQRLKEIENQQLGWNLRRDIAKINYKIHTDAIKERLVPQVVNTSQANAVYASEADLLNVALFGQTAAQWRTKHPSDKGNMRDSANVTQLVCLANLENLNAVFIREGLSQAERLKRLNAVAIHQMTLLTDNPTMKKLKG